MIYFCQDAPGWASILDRLRLIWYWTILWDVSTSMGGRSQAITSHLVLSPLSAIIWLLVNILDWDLYGWVSLIGVLGTAAVNTIIVVTSGASWGIDYGHATWGFCWVKFWGGRSISGGFGIFSGSGHFFEIFENTFGLEWYQWFRWLVITNTFLSFGCLPS